MYNLPTETTSASRSVATGPNGEACRDEMTSSTCYTAARFGDVQLLNFDDIRDSTWFLRMNKTKSDARIYLIPQAMAIIEKYRALGSLPSISSQRMNDYLKELGRIAGIVEPVRIVRYMGAKRNDDCGPKWQFMTSHTARRTFVTLSLERGMRPEVLMTLTGHRSFKTMKRYIAHTERSRQEEMERVWMGNGRQSSQADYNVPNQRKD
jgi:integrase